MRILCLAALFASACAFTTNVPSVGERVHNVAASGSAHRNRRATIVMDGKANGEFYVDSVPGRIRTTREN